MNFFRVFLGRFHPHLNHGRVGACRPPTLRPDELQVMLGSANRAECRLREPTGHCGREHFAADAPDAEIFGRKVGNFVIFEQKPLKINENL